MCLAPFAILRGGREGGKIRWFDGESSLAGGHAIVDEGGGEEEEEKTGNGLSLLRRPPLLLGGFVHDGVS